MSAYAYDANIVRLFISDEFFGTDDITRYFYINGVIYNGKLPQQMVALYDGTLVPKFGFHPDGDGYSSWVSNGASPETQDAIGPLCETLNKTDSKDQGQIDKLGNLFEIDGLLRFIVMEYLAGVWDDYLFAQNNDGAYRGPAQNNKWYYLDQDYDAIFGVNLDEPEGQQLVNISYARYPRRYPGVYMINTLFQNDGVRVKFESYLKDTVSVLFNNVTLTNRILKYHKFSLPDL